MCINIGDVLSLIGHCLISLDPLFICKFCSIKRFSLNIMDLLLLDYTPDEQLFQLSET